MPLSTMATTTVSEPLVTCHAAGTPMASRYEACAFL